MDSRAGTPAIGRLPADARNQLHPARPPSNTGVRLSVHGCCGGDGGTAGAELFATTGGRWSSLSTFSGRRTWQRIRILMGCCMDYCYAKATTKTSTVLTFLLKGLLTFSTQEQKLLGPSRTVSGRLEC
ncbi:hypothetical protein M6B38_285840 [Iris pallida]|uniref:Uncharacterized protein n=1 Tax=Iris pallida TaxID=29817 RepID=A0AAX6HYN6_IRIPA|nr:hypothetical protein M6B38_285840 [Iris pallida]